LAPSVAAELVLMAQAASAVMLAVHIGFEGSQVLFGVLLGLVGAFGFGDWARVLDVAAPGFALLWYVTGAAAGFFLYTLLRPSVLAVLSPLLGGGFFVASSGALLSRLYRLIAGQLDFLPSQAPLLPEPHEPLSEVVGALLGSAGVGAVPWHCGCAAIAALLHGCTQIRALAIGALLGSIMLVFASSISCRLGATVMGCPTSSEPAEEWQWMAFGSFLWTSLTAAAAWRQLGMLADWEAESFWRGLLTVRVSEREDSGSPALQDGYACYPQPPWLNGSDSPGGAFRTKFPHEFGGGSPASQQEEPPSFLLLNESPPPLDAGLRPHIDYAAKVASAGWSQLAAANFSPLRMIGLDACCSSNHRTRRVVLAGGGLNAAPSHPCYPPGVM